MGKSESLESLNFKVSFKSKNLTIFYHSNMKKES